MSIESMIADQKAAKAALKASLGKIAKKSPAGSKAPGAAARSSKRKLLRDTAEMVIADAIERIREDAPNYGTLEISGKTASLLKQKPKQFKIHKQ